MRYTPYMLFVATLVLVAGCTIQRGQLDFPNPWFDAHCGPVALVAFRSSTVVQIGGTYFALALPFYAPIILAVMLFAAIWFFIRRRAHVSRH